LALADRCLKPSGSLVFFLPVAATYGNLGFGDDGDGNGEVEVDAREAAAEAVLLALLPSHPALEVVAVGRDAVATRMHRLLVTMKRRPAAAVPAGAAGKPRRGREPGLEQRPWHYEA
jgi:hypothetical protein